jgi:hypothetical protein
MTIVEPYEKTSYEELKAAQGPKWRLTLFELFDLISYS